MKPDILHKILERKRQEVETARRALPEAVVRRLAEERPERRPFFQRLQSPLPHGVNIIAEIKRGSPSRGILRGDLDPARQAKLYQKGGAAAVSVLTDASFFHGSSRDLKEARSAVNLPILRKDFILSTYQVYESAAMGADAVLLIVRALSREFLRDCLSLCGELLLDALVEVHSQEDLETATWAGASLIGINNRDLGTFRTDVEVSVRMAARLDPRQVGVAESGIENRGQVERVLGAGIWNFLVGESLVRAENPVELLGRLLGRPNGKGFPGRAQKEGFLK
ncbi:MAG TPA: indole-3-glycerol phosphate synthase TrpC [Syntrophobacteraceae bacterium]|nr:indole-3-glycerol phosphate synthase TrpC [Syntrophobacteraceae bacterium]